MFFFLKKNIFFHKYSHSFARVSKNAGELGKRQKAKSTHIKESMDLGLMKMAMG